MTISIASDHGGFALKAQLVDLLRAQGHEVFDRGCPDTTSVDYPDYARFVCTDIREQKVDYGVLICVTGVGMSIYANKFRGIRAALVTNDDVAAMTRAHNDSNIICLGAKYTTAASALGFIDIFINTPFAGGRHERRVNKIREKENENE